MNNQTLSVTFQLVGAVKQLRIAEPIGKAAFTITDHTGKKVVSKQLTHNHTVSNDRHSCIKVQEIPLESFESTPSISAFREGKKNGLISFDVYKMEKWVIGVYRKLPLDTRIKLHMEDWFAINGATSATW